MKRSGLTPMPAYFDRYINQCDDVEVLDAIKISIAEISSFPLDKWNLLGDRVYAPGKWTVKDVLQHLIDTERIFAYRALAFARDEATALPSFSEDGYAKAAIASGRKLESLVEELETVHRSVYTMYASFTPEMLGKMGMGFKGKYSVASIGFILPGHQRWHLRVLEEKYYPLVNH